MKQGKLTLDLFEVLRKHLPGEDNDIYRRAEALAKLSRLYQKPQIRSGSPLKGRAHELLTILQVMVRKMVGQDVEGPKAWVADLSTSHSLDQLKELLDMAWADLWGPALERRAKAK